MNREEFIEMLVKLARIRYNLSETELNEFRTVLEMMPDRESLDTSIQQVKPKKNPWPQNFDNIPLMYGPPR